MAAVAVVGVVGVVDVVFGVVGVVGVVVVAVVVAVVVVAGSGSGSGAGSGGCGGGGGRSVLRGGIGAVGSNEDILMLVLLALALVAVIVELFKFNKFILGNDIDEILTLIREVALRFLFQMAPLKPSIRHQWVLLCWAGWPTRIGLDRRLLAGLPPSRLAPCR